MRCQSCNKWLTDFESTRKSVETGDYLDLCNKCLEGLDIATIDRTDLKEQAEKDRLLEELLEPFKDLVEDPDPYFEDEVQHEED